MGSTTNLNWWVYRISEPSTVHQNTGCYVASKTQDNVFSMADVMETTVMIRYIIQMGKRHKTHHSHQLLLTLFFFLKCDKSVTLFWSHLKYQRLHPQLKKSGVKRHGCEWKGGILATLDCWCLSLWWPMTAFWELWPRYKRCEKKVWYTPEIWLSP